MYHDYLLTSKSIRIQQKKFLSSAEAEALKVERLKEEVGRSKREWWERIQRAHEQAAEREREIRKLYEPLDSDDDTANHATERTSGDYFDLNFGESKSASVTGHKRNPTYFDLNFCDRETVVPSKMGGSRRAWNVPLYDSGDVDMLDNGFEADDEDEGPELPDFGGGHFKAVEPFDIEAFKMWVKTQRARHRREICISASVEQRRHFQIFERFGDVLERNPDMGLDEVAETLERIEEQWVLGRKNRCEDLTEAQGYVQNCDETQTPENGEQDIGEEIFIVDL